MLTNVKSLTRLPVLLGLMMVGTPVPAQADSDGYYCVGPDYIAYELRGKAPRRTHHLYVLSIAESARITKPAAVALPQFQTHGMRCGATTVQVLGWDSLYTVDLSTTIRSVAVEAVAAGNAGGSRRVPPGFEVANLGGWSRAATSGRPDTIPLALGAGGCGFVLAFDVRPKSKENPCVSRVVTRLVQLDGRGHVVHSVILFDGEGHRECGE